jgi:hypothetical protein
LGLAQFYSTGPNPPGQPAHRPFFRARARLGVVPTAPLSVPTAPSATARRAAAIPTAASCLPPPRATHAGRRVQHSEPMSGRWRPACTTAARPPATSRRRCRPTLLTSRHLRSTRCTCSHRLCTLPPHRRSGGKAIHSSSHSYRRAPATPLEPPSPSCLDRRLWSSSGHTCSTPSTAQVPGTSTFTSTPASTPSPVCRRQLFPARAHRRGELPTVSIPPPFASNRSHHRPGPLLGYFPTDQRQTAGRISPVSRDVGGGGDFPPMFPRLGRNTEETGPFS